METAAVRGCGTRVKGGLYVEVATADWGLPLECFLVDPPLLIDPKELNLSPIGVKMIEDPHGNRHILDWVGETFYPFAADFLAEGKIMGFSRRISPDLPLSLLNWNSRLAIAHPKGYIHNHEGAVPAEVSPFVSLEEHCPRVGACPGDRFAPHVNEMCVAQHWVVAPSSTDQSSGEVPVRNFASTSYFVFPPPDDYTPEFGPAIIAKLPISRLVVVAAEDGSHHDTLHAVRERSKLPVIEVPE